MFKVSGWGGGCGGSCHMKFNDNPESVGFGTLKLDSGLSNSILIFY